MQSRTAWSLAIWVVLTVVIAWGVLGVHVDNLVPKHAETERRERCRRNVAALVREWRVAREERRFDAKLHGARQIVSWMPSRTASEALRCPGDTAPGAFSYAVRDFERFPVAAGDAHAWVLCDRQGEDGRTMQHKGGLVVGFSDGEAKFMTREELGVNSEEPVVVGPDAQNAELRRFERP